MRPGISGPRSPCRGDGVSPHALAVSHIAALLLRAISGRSPGLVVGGRERLHGGDSKSSSESIMLQIVSCCSIMLRRILQPCVDGLEAKLYQSKKKEAGCGRWHLLEVPLELLRGRRRKRAHEVRGDCPAGQARPRRKGTARSQLGLWLYAVCHQVSIC